MNDWRRKRVTMKLKNPNPLFEKWLTEWRDKAIRENSKMQYCFKLALQSLKKYPLPLERGRDCKILKGFGDKLCIMIDNKLKEHQVNKNDILNATIIGNHPIVDEYKEPPKKKAKSKLHPELNGSPTKNRLSKEYSPIEGSGGYAILITLYTESLKPTYPGFLFKQEIIERGQHLSHTSFNKPDPGSRYTAWSSMKTLLTKNLVLKKSNPAKFSLSDEGISLAKKLFDKSHNQSLNSDTTDISFQISRKIINQDVICLDSSDEEAAPTVEQTSGTSSSSQNYPYCDDYPLDMLNSNEQMNTIEKDACSTSSKSSDSTIILSENKEASSTKSSSRVIEKYASSSSVASSSTQECFILPPNTFEIILYIDTCETSGSNTIVQDEPILAELQSLGIKYEVKKLKIGDYIWICRDKNSNKELVLPYVIERKRMDDFGSSIKDGRYHEQKFRLKRSGIQNVTYLIEKYGNNQHVGLPVSTLLQAATNTTIQDGFCVTFTENIRHTARYLANFSKILIKMFQAKTLVSCPKENLSEVCITDDLISIMTFKEFNQTSTKNKPMKISDLFVKMLLQIKGMSVDRALAIVRMYPTPALLRQAYEEYPEDKGEKLLAQVEFGECNKRIGPVLSKIVYKLFSLQSFN